ncbi:MAG: hypothetical protein ABFE07_20565 [Armatimonadia bacterium]
MEHECFALLEEHDALRARLLALEPRLRKATSDYGVNHLRVWGYTPDMLRRDMKKSVAAG